MMRLTIATASLFLGACESTTAAPPAMTPAINVGCTVEFVEPYCAPPGPLPLFNANDNAQGLALAFERLKSEYQKSRSCTDKLRQSIVDFRAACEKEEE